MKAIFTFDEMVYNTVCTGKVIYYDKKKKTIDYIKVDKKSRQLVVHCTDKTVFPCHQDDLFEFEVSSRKTWLRSTNPRLRGKDRWGTKEIEK